MASATAGRVKAGQQEEALAAQVEEATREIELQDPDAGASASTASSTARPRCSACCSLPCSPPWCS